jgi:hypothetical protein
MTGGQAQSLKIATQKFTFIARGLRERCALRKMMRDALRFEAKPEAYAAYLRHWRCLDCSSGLVALACGEPMETMIKWRLSGRRDLEASKLGL